MPEIRTAAENRALLDKLIPRHQRLAAERIRKEAEIERLTGELEEIEAEIMAAFDTKDPAEIERKLAEADEQATAVVDALAETIDTIERRLAEANRGN